MKLSIVALVTVSLVIAAAISSHALEDQARPLESGCADSCDLASHRTAMPRMASSGMGDMSGMSGTSDTQAATPSPDSSMSHMKMQPGHMTMSPSRPANAADRVRAEGIIASLRAAIAPYKDYHVAEDAGYKPFHPEWKLPMYHFTNWQNALANLYSFDPARPTSLMYKKIPGGYELAGAMYTAPRNATLDELDARVPLSVATWHEHTNLCLPPPGAGAEAFGPNARFGLAGSITTQEACTHAGGTFKPIIYNWMVHVWPFEPDPSKVWASEDHPGTMNH